jgi:hypothetical protein
MRVLIGIILGVVLTVGTAYIYDSHNALAAQNAPGATQKTLVNWDIAAAEWQRLTQRARVEWGRIAG